MAKFTVHMLAYQPEYKTRIVEVPEDQLRKTSSGEEVLSMIFHFGQNDFRPVPDTCSVSMGDVIEYDGKLYLIKPIGYAKMTIEQYTKYVQMPRRDRTFCELITGKVG